MNLQAFFVFCNITLAKKYIFSFERQLYQKNIHYHVPFLPNNGDKIVRN